MGALIPQGPRRHCGNPENHDRHPNLPTDGSWCDGLQPLVDFVEVTVRMPLADFYGPYYDYSKDDFFAHVREDNVNIPNWLWGSYDGPYAVRLRKSGKDRYYQCPNAEWPESE